MAGSFLDNIDLSQLEAYLSGAAKSSASANEAEGRYYNARDAIKAQLFGTQQNAATAANAQALNNAKFTTALPGQGASEAVRGSMIQNMQDVGMDLGNNRANVINFTGGTRPSNLTPAARQAGADLITHGQGLIANPGSYVPAAQTVAPPGLSPEPKAGFWGQAAAAGGTAAGILKALGGAPSSGGGGDLGKIINALRGKSPNGSETEANSPQTQEEDTRGTGETSGRALGPDGQPLPVDSEPYYDDATGQMVFPDQGGGGNSGGGLDPSTYGTNWWDEGYGQDPNLWNGGGAGDEEGFGMAPNDVWGG